MTTSIEDRESSANRSLERALHLLLFIERARAPQSLTEISTATALAKPTVQRILAVLERYRLVEKRQGRWQLGAGVLPLAHGYLLGNELPRVALPVLQQLAVATGETASLFVRCGFHRVVVQRVEGADPLRYVLPIGQRLPLHVGVGKVLAAAMPDDERSALIASLGEMQHAGGVPLARQQLLDELARVRRQGYSVSRNERELGIASVAAPVKDGSGAVVAAVSVAGPVERFDARSEALVVEVSRAARAISERYGKF